MSSDAETDPAEIRDKAITLLAAREHSVAELRRKLARHFDDRDAVDAVLVELASDGYQSDVRFAEARVRASLNRGHGPLMIRQKLQAAGVEAGLIEQAMEALDVDWPEEARAILDSKFGSRPAADRRETARRARFLASRGFSSDVIGRLLLD